jgi:hypothetical protein
MGATWDFLLCDGRGNALAELTTASGKQISYSRNHYAFAQFVVSHQDEAAKLLLEAVGNGPMPTLRAYRRAPGASTATLRFNGYLAPFTEELAEQQLITPIFRSPFGRFYGDGTSGAGIYTGASILAEEKEQGQIAKSLIELYGSSNPAPSGTDPTFGIVYPSVSYAGLDIGTIATDGVKRSITYPYANIGQAIINLSECLTGFDFDETFVEEGETLARFNTYVRQGEPKPGAVFNFGPTTLANVAKLDRTTSDPITVVRLLGANGLKSEKRHTEGIEKYGEWMQQEQVSDATSQSVLDARAEALLVGAPVKTLAITPDFAAPECPTPWDDFWLGDEVTFYGSDGGFEESMNPRVNEITIVVDENGNETSTIPQPQASTAESPDALHTVFKVQA